MIAYILKTIFWLPLALYEMRYGNHNEYARAFLGFGIYCYVVGVVFLFGVGVVLSFVPDFGPFPLSDVLLACGAIYMIMGFLIRYLGAPYKVLL